MLRKTNILVTFLHYTIICSEQFAPYTVIRHYTIIKFDRFATLYFYLAYTFIWPSRVSKMLNTVLVNADHGCDIHPLLNHMTKLNNFN